MKKSTSSAGSALQESPHACAQDAEQTTTLSERLMQVAAGDSARLAIVDSESKLTYDAVLKRSAAFCDELALARVLPGDRVATILPNGAEFLISAFGVWKRAAVLVPLGTQLRETELLRYLRESSASTVITHYANESTIENLREKGAPIQHIWFCGPHADQWRYRATGDGRSQVEQAGEDSVDIGSEPPALFQYSTGTTGWPKRITRTHRQVLQEHHAKATVLRTTPDDRILGVAPFFHSHGLMNCALLTLFSGGTLYTSETFFPRDIARLIERERITGFPGTPHMFQLLAELNHVHDFSSLRFALSGGAPLTESIANAFERAYNVRVRQHYGSTETGLVTICADRRHTQDLRSVGHPLPGVAVEVVDECGNPQPAGITGHVKITSEFAARGYDSVTGSSESYFQDKSFFPGDLGQMTPDGDLILCGRNRAFINVGGNKVDPLEVEMVLAELQGVTEAVVFGIAEATGGEKVKAVVVAAVPLTPAAVRAHCASRLAPFKNPKVIEFCTELPRSPLGKVLRKYLMDEASGTEPMKQ